jgi:hypothetical protein
MPQWNEPTSRICANLVLLVEIHDFIDDRCFMTLDDSDHLA